MRRMTIVVVLAAIILAHPIKSTRAGEAPVETSFAYHWLDVMLEVAAREVERVGARPTIISRQMGMAVTAMYDAWACYDDKAVGTCFGASMRRPLAERTLENKKKAIAYAMYRVLHDVYAVDAVYLAEQMNKYGYDPNDNSGDLATAQGIGNRIGVAIVDSRHHDGANQLGDEIGSNGKPYSDYTYYKPATGDSSGLPQHWCPIEFDDGKGGKIAPGFLTPHWYRVKSFALKSPDQFRPGPPPAQNSVQLIKEVTECVECNANLTDEQKATVEFMRDGPRSTGQSGHWLKLAQEVSHRDHNDLDRDVKLYFCVGNVAMDAFISCWETKRYYDTSRPYCLVHYYFKDKLIRGWGGPGKGTIEMKGQDWLPYSPGTFITPPFPGYTSGHATVSGASAKILELFTGSDRFGIEEVRPCCKLTEPIPGKFVHLKLSTFTSTAEMAALSRMLGGYHIRTDNEEGLKAGQKIGAYEWPIFQAYFDGTYEK